MTDRELLEKAAQAFWAGEIDDVVSIRWCDVDACILYIHGDNQDHNGIDREYRWNPLEENHDAFELVVKLRLTVDAMPNEGPCVDDGHDSVREPWGADPCAATRRAVVRAAAALAPKGT